MAGSKILMTYDEFKDSIAQQTSQWEIRIPPDRIQIAPAKADRSDQTDGLYMKMAMLFDFTDVHQM